MRSGAFLISWTIWLALAGYFLGLAGIVFSRVHSGLQSAARMLWTLGCLFYLGHVFTAFQFFHNWSHQSAVFETARQTKEVIGVPVGFGIYITYFFTLLWVLDTVWWWRAGHAAYRKRSKPISVAIHIFLLFIIANGTIVFEGGLLRWISLSALISLAILWWRYKGKSHNLSNLDSISTSHRSLTKN